MILKEERELIVEYGKKLITSGLTKGTGGNISIFNREKQLMAISPSGIDYFETKAEDVVVLDLDGNKVDGIRKPSSELLLHSIFYKERSDVNAVIHTHSIFSTTIATLNQDLPATNYYIAIAGGNSVRCAEYATFGSEELAKNALKAMENRYACYLANHGLLTAARDIHGAMDIAINIEHITEAHLRALAVGKPVVLSDEEIDKNLKLFPSYGQ